MLRPYITIGRRGPPGAAGANGTNGTNGTNGATGAPGANGASFALGTPVAVSPTLGVAVQAADSSKPALISVNVRANLSVVLGNVQDVVEIRIGPNNTVASGGGTKVGEMVVGITGLALTAGMVLQQQTQLTAVLPAGWFYAVRRTTGTAATIVSAISQPLS